MAMPKVKIDYDDEGEVLYVSFGIDEPSYCEHLNNFLLLELGMFTDQPTGFRIIQPRKRDIKKTIADMVKIYHERMRTVERNLHRREEFVKKDIKQVGKIKELAGVT